MELPRRRRRRPDLIAGPRPRRLLRDAGHARRAVRRRWDRAGGAPVARRRASASRWCWAHFSSPSRPRRWASTAGACSWASRSRWGSSRWPCSTRPRSWRSRPRARCSLCWAVPRAGRSAGPAAASVVLVLPLLIAAEGLAPGESPLLAPKRSGSTSSRSPTGPRRPTGCSRPASRPRCAPSSRARASAPCVGASSRLTALSGGRTRLAEPTGCRHRIAPAGYWRLWSDAVLYRIHTRVLNHVARLAEADAAHSEEAVMATIM